MFPTNDLSATKIYTLKEMRLFKKKVSILTFHIILAK